MACGLDMSMDGAGSGWVYKRLMEWVYFFLFYHTDRPVPSTSTCRLEIILRTSRISVTPHSTRIVPLTASRPVSTGASIVTSLPQS